MTNSNEVNERFREWLRISGSGTKELIMWTGMSKSSVSQIMNDKIWLTTKTIVKILEFNKSLNARWLLTGIGDMDILIEKDRNSDDKDAIIRELNRIIDAKDEIIRLLKERDQK